MAARIALVLVALAAGLGLAACGGDGSNGTTNGQTTTTTADDDTETTDETTTAAGRSIFVESCGSCHALDDAGTTGAVGPNLDDASLSVDGVEQQVREGGGDMPAFEGTLSDDEIAAVAEYVVEAQGS